MKGASPSSQKERTRMKWKGETCGLRWKKPWKSPGRKGTKINGRRPARVVLRGSGRGAGAPAPRGTCARPGARTQPRGSDRPSR
eukprot:15343657-Heterocapsa_arctica.AAC.1